MTAVRTPCFLPQVEARTAPRRRSRHMLNSRKRAVRYPPAPFRAATPWHTPGRTALPAEGVLDPVAAPHLALQRCAKGHFG